MLPTPTTSFVGREREQAELLALLGVRRLVTIIGPGGVGKTRLALALAAEPSLAPHARLIDLAPLRSPEQVLPAIGHALAINRDGDTPLLDLLVATLDARPLLLVLDNFEQVVEAAPLLAQLLVLTRQLRFLITSRVPLRISNEREYLLEPLANAAGYGGELAPAAQLFLDRAQAVRPELRSDSATIALVTAICRRLDGLPLALELAAARLRVLTLPALLERLDRRLPLLVSGPRDAPARQRTLRDTIAWGVELLPEAEQALFRRTAIFASSWSLPAAAALNASDELAMLDSLSMLIEHQLVRAIDVGGEPRYTMLETVREYAGELLETDPQQASYWQGMAAYYLAFVPEAMAATRGADQLRWLARIEAELPNLRSLLKYLLAAEAAAPALQLTAALVPFWHSRGDTREARDWLLAVLALLPAEAGADTNVQRLRAEGQRLTGWLMAFTGEAVTGTQLAQRALLLYQSLGDTLAIVRTCETLGDIYSEQGEIEAALDCYQQALAGYSGQESTAAYAQALHNLGSSLVDHQRYDEAIFHFNQAIQLRQSLGDRWGGSISLANLGWALLCAGRSAEARPLLLKSLAMHHTMSYLVGVCLTFEWLADIAGQQNDYWRTTQLFAYADQLRRRHHILSWVIDYPRAVACLRAARQRLGMADFQAAWRTGASLSYEAAYELASLQPAPPRPVEPAQTEGITASLRFVGRSRELLELEQRLSDPNCRLLTLLGLGGMGKTRLARELSVRLASAFPAGSCFVALQAVSERSGLIAALAEALQIDIASTQQPFENVLVALSDRELLLVLDNVEQLRHEAAMFATIVERAPGLRLLLTSREPLGLGNEWRYQLHGLDLPVGEQGGLVAESSAVQLFAEQARRLWPHFDLAAEGATVARICQLLGGIPLAIELAAAWTQSISCSGIAHALEQNFDLLAQQQPDKPARHRSIRLVFDQVWERLGVEERVAFASCAVFRGSFSLEAASHVVRVAPVVLAALVERALLKRETNDRYSIHELLRQYGAQQLAQQPQLEKRVQGAHGAYYCGLLERLAPDLYGANQLQAAEAINSEIENIRAAWRWAVQVGASALIERAGYSWWAYHQHFAPARDGIELFGQAIERLRPMERTTTNLAALAHMLLYLGWLQFRIGLLEIARPLFLESQMLYEQLALAPHPGFTTDPRLGLAMLALWRGRSVECWQLASAAEQRAASDNQQTNRAWAWYLKAGAARIEGRYQVARQLGQQALHASEALGNRWFRAYCLDELGSIARAEGAMAKARDYYGASYQQREALGDLQGMAITSAHLAKIAFQQGDLAAAEAIYERSLNYLRSRNNHDMIIEPLHGLALLAIARHEHEQARVVLNDAFDEASLSGYDSFIPTLLTTGSQLLLAVEQPALAASLLTCVLRHGANQYENFLLAQQLLLRCERALTGEHFAAATSAGQKLDLQQAVLHLRGLLSMPLTQPAPTSPATEPPPAMPTAPDALTPREREVLALLAAGLTNKEIASQLISSVHTVNSHVKSIFAKLGVTTRAAATRAALAQGIVADG
jgi:predicted ATPase/DNA-binding NarL/FixJ family response regulator